MAWCNPLLFSFSHLRVVLVVCALMLVVQTSSAQPFYFGNEAPRASSTGMLGYSVVNFEYNGEDSDVPTLNYDTPLFSVTYSQANLFAALSFGSQNAPDTTTNDLSFLDFTGALWGEVFLSEAATEAKNRVFVPITLFTNYRKVAPKGIDALEEFNITTLGLGLGLGFYGQFSENVLLEIRSVPVIGVAVRSFGDSAGNARLIDNDIQLHFGSVFKTIGISLGYHFRVMVWDVNTSSVFGNLSEDLFNYRETFQTFSIGVNW